MKAKVEFLKDEIVKAHNELNRKMKLFIKAESDLDKFAWNIEVKSLELRIELLEKHFKVELHRI